jgi:hypothetical protein
MSFRYWVKKQASLGMSEAHRKMLKKLSQEAEKLSTAMRSYRHAYEMYLYQAVGRKVDFEEALVSKESGTNYSVTIKYIVLKNNTETMAPRFYVTLNLNALPSGEIQQTINAGFINAIGMWHSKFTQESFDAEQLASPANTFGWVEYLEGDFLQGKRLVKPFGPANAMPDMGTRNAFQKRGGFNLTEDVRKLTRQVSQNRGFPANAISFLHTDTVLTLLAYLDHYQYYDEGTLVREAMVNAIQFEEGKTSDVGYEDLVSPLEDFELSCMQLDLAPTREGDVRGVLEALAALLEVLQAPTCAAKVERAALMMR